MRSGLHLVPLVALACTSATELAESPENRGIGDPPALEPATVTDEFVGTRLAMDVLIVLDRTESMAEQQAQLCDSAPEFVERLHALDVDFHLAVVGMNADGLLLADASGVTWLDVSYPAEDAAQRLCEMSGGTAPGESGRASAYRMVEEQRDHPNNLGFYREHARLELVFVSDKDDASGDSPVSLQEFRIWMRSLKGGGVTGILSVRAHALVDPPNQECADGQEDGNDYDSYTSQGDGLVQNICDADWAPFLDLIPAPLEFRTLSRRLDVYGAVQALQTLEDDGGSVQRDFEVCVRDGSIDPWPAGCDAWYAVALNMLVLPSVLQDGETLTVTYTPR